MKAVITGGSGFVGRALAARLHQLGDEAVVVDIAGGSENAEFIRLDMAGLSSLPEKAGRADVFYHLAWAGSAGEGRADTALQLRNAQWTVDAVHAAHAMGCARFVGAGSIMEWETLLAAEKQGNAPGMGYIYGAGKAAAHMMSKPVAAKLGIGHVWAVLTNAYGEGERSPRFINTTIGKILSGQPLQFTAATQNYDFVHIDDVANALALMGKRGEDCHQYVIGSGHARPLRGFIEEMISALSPGAEASFDLPYTGVSLPLQYFDTSATEGLGFKPAIGFTEGVRRTRAWLEENDGRL